MSDKAAFRQCILNKSHATGFLQQTVWIPEQFAVHGKALKLKDDDDNWSNGWVVVRVSATSVPEDSLPDWRTAIRTHRKNTGDSLPKQMGRNG